MIQKKKIMKYLMIPCFILLLLQFMSCIDDSLDLNGNSVGEDITRNGLNFEEMVDQNQIEGDKKDEEEMKVTDYPHILTKRILISREIYPELKEDTLPKTTIHKYTNNQKRWYAVSFFYNKEKITAGTDIASIPLVLFSSGLGFKFKNYEELIKKIANKGYIVAAIEHADIDSSVLLGLVLAQPNLFFMKDAKNQCEKRYYDYKADPNKNIFKYPVPEFNYALYEYMAVDVKCFLDKLEASLSVTINDENRNFDLIKVINKKQIVYSGHSLGGMAATLMICKKKNDLPDSIEDNPYYDDRIKGVISFDGNMYNHQSYTYAPSFEVAKPYFMIGSDGMYDKADMRADNFLATDEFLRFMVMKENVRRFGVEVYGTVHIDYLDTNERENWVLNLFSTILVNAGKWVKQPPKSFLTTRCAQYTDLFLKGVFSENFGALDGLLKDHVDKKKIDYIR